MEILPSFKFLYVNIVQTSTFKIYMPPANLRGPSENSALIFLNLCKTTILRGINSISEPILSINYIGRVFHVSYFGREVYGEIVFCSNAFFHELLVYE